MSKQLQKQINFQKMYFIKTKLGIDVYKRSTIKVSLKK